MTILPCLRGVLRDAGTLKLFYPGVTLDKARALYLVRVSELHVKSMYKIDRWGSKNRILGNYRWFCTKLIERGGAFQKLFTLTDPKHAHYHCYWICLVGHKIKHYKHTQYVHYLGMFSTLLQTKILNVFVY